MKIDIEIISAYDSVAQKHIEAVKYEDHVAIVEGLKKEIEDAREEGRIAALVSEGVYERRDVYW